MKRRFIDSNGNPSERRINGQDVVIHYVDLPPKDVTTVKGIPCTTALRTVIDIATDTHPDRLVEMVDDCLRRKLFTIAEAEARLAEDDMRAHPGAPLVRAALRR